MFGDSFMGLGTELFTKGSGKLPACGFYETEENYCLSLKLPGISKEDVNISLSGNNLIVKGEKKHNNESESEQHYHRERYYGSFYRSVQLPANVDQDKISANFSDGVLNISIPKSEKQIKKIDIK
ncbi:Hsp20/alpha crystallin family protein [Wolbachia endosymbiont of Ctenocephalides felis wCfeJ]|uniref:Hsp20/alpha crystallin family protein n=1 Tax=Wolbachia endosymbiont of Ctenocephalides felis wCfeJ TaxID=2732594 RepID=UPI001445B2BE|nr:Hsp20/alpha crystallin family protein [Wolbachia endosymbiont of Ctenocephalides felis wCfeJ]WCR58502.1 MAG: Spore protein SP21 [Wolbachia endosymbiont of Ctenocephalides felis wCfeJ]